MVNNFQRLGSTSNSHVGRAFETAAQHSSAIDREKRQAGLFSSHRLLSSEPENSNDNYPD